MGRLSLSAAKILRLDRRAIEELGIPSVVLMDNAGRSVAQEVLKILRGKTSPRVTVVCGAGNNAGDGFVAARYLQQSGIRTTTYLTMPESTLKDDAQVFYAVLQKLKYPVFLINSQSINIRSSFQKSDVLVDSLFGVGLNRMIGPPFFRIIEEMNASGKPIVSVDVPSGLDATTGAVQGIAIRARRTVTFTVAKNGFFVGQGPKHTGKIIVSSIGIPKEFLKKDHKHET